MAIGSALSNKYRGLSNFPNLGKSSFFYLLAWKSVIFWKVLCLKAESPSRVNCSYWGTYCSNGVWGQALSTYAPLTITFPIAQLTPDFVNALFCEHWHLARLTVGDGDGITYFVPKISILLGNVMWRACLHRHIKENLLIPVLEKL